MLIFVMAELYNVSTFSCRILISFDFYF